MDFLPRLCMSPPVTESNSAVVINDADVIRVLIQHTRAGLQTLADKWLNKYSATELDSAILMPLFSTEEPDHTTGNPVRVFKMPTTEAILKRSAIFATLGQMLIEFKGKDVSILSDKIIMDRVTTIVTSIANNTSLSHLDNNAFSRIISDTLGTVNDPKSVEAAVKGVSSGKTRPTAGMSLNCSRDIQAWDNSDVLGVIGAGTLYEWTPANRLIYADREIYSPLGISYDDLMRMVKLMLAPHISEPNSDSVINPDLASDSNGTSTTYDWVNHSGLSLLTFLSIYDAAISSTWSNLRTNRTSGTIASWGYRLMQFSYILNTYVNTVSRLRITYNAIRAVKLYDLHPMKTAFSDLQLMPLKELQTVLPNLLSHDVMLNLAESISKAVDAITPTGAILKSELPILLLTESSPNDLLPTADLNKLMIDFEPGMCFEETIDFITKEIDLTNIPTSAASLAHKWTTTLRHVKDVSLDLDLQSKFFSDRQAEGERLSFNYQTSSLMDVKKPRVFYNSIFDGSWYRTGLRRFDKETGLHTYNAARGSYINHDKLIHDSIQSENYFPALFNFDPDDMPAPFLTCHLPAEYLTGETFLPITSLGSHGEMAIFEKDAAQLHMQPSTLFDITTQSLNGSKLSALFYSIAGNYMPVFTSVDKLKKIAKNLRITDNVTANFSVPNEMSSLNGVLKTQLYVNVFAAETKKNTVRYRYQSQLSGDLTTEVLNKLPAYKLHTTPGLSNASINGMPIPSHLYYVSLVRSSALPIWGLPSVAQTNLNCASLGESTWRNILETALYSHTPQTTLLIPVECIPSRYAHSRILFDNKDEAKTYVQDIKPTHLHAHIYNVTRTRMFIFDTLYPDTAVAETATVFNQSSLTTDDNSKLYTRATWTDLAANYAHLRFTFRPRSTFHQSHTFMGWGLGGYQAVFFKQSDMISLSRDEILSAPHAVLSKATPLFSVTLKVAMDHVDAQTKQNSVIDSYVEHEQPLSTVKDSAHKPALAAGGHTSLTSVVDAINKIEEADKLNEIKIETAVEVKPAGERSASDTEDNPINVV